MFKGEFGEANTKQANLVEDDPVAFKAVINWLYGAPFACNKCREGPDTDTPNHLLPLIAVYILADKYGIEELSQQCVNVCDTCLATLHITLTEPEAAMIYGKFGVDCNLKAWAIRSVVEMFFSPSYGTDSVFESNGTDSKFESWSDFKEALDNNHEEFKNDWIRAIRDHRNIKASECDIHECLYKHQGAFDFVLDNDMPI